MESQSTSSEPSPSISVSPKEESPREEKREAVKEQKKAKRPLTEKRIAQLAAARAARKKKADERRAQKESSRLVKDDGESANRYLEVLKSNSPDIEISKSESKKQNANSSTKEGKRKGK